MPLRNFFTSKNSLLKFQRIIDNLMFGFAVLGFLAIFADVGQLVAELKRFFDSVYQFALVVFFLLLCFRTYINFFLLKRKRERWVVVMELLFLLVLLLSQCGTGLFVSLASREFLQLAIFVIFVVEISTRSLQLEHIKMNPALLFIISFLIIIIVGAFALMLPNSTVSKEFKFIDALFTSTSAVCVTGLSVVDPGTFFTRFGQNVILVLVSLGGLGVMTFTSFFGLFFKGEASFKNQLIYKDFTGADQLKDVFSTIVKIVTFTIGVEMVGTAVLFFSLNSKDFGGDFSEQLYFSIFHSISAFNNAGFQLKAQGLYDPILRYNYLFHTTVALLIIFGGLGFFISFNIVDYLKVRLFTRFRQWFLGEPYAHVPWFINFNSRIVLRTTAILLIVGTVLMYITEYNSSLKEHGEFGKWIVAFFMSVTPRTAGFNNIDMATLTREGMLLTIFLMWVGASPGSTGGGIKTSTFAVATMGIFNIARGRDHVEFARREVAQESLLRAFIVIALSLIALGFSTVAVGYYNPEIALDKIIFECFSAFGTVGLSLGITAQLTTASKAIISLTMFVGRVGMYTLLLGFLKKALDTKHYRYPVENVIIT
ncbi:MAG: ATPase [Saprospiraceae bacterium]|nr:ATPase [Saprospiraceae bacterium]